MVATSQPLATRAGLRALERGGNAADAALAAAAVLAVTEPTGNGIGGDNFAIVWKDGRADGLDSAGPAPQTPSADAESRSTARRSVTVPGAVGGWAALAERYGRLGLDACLADAIDAAENGFAVTPLTAAAWGRGAQRVPRSTCRRRAWGRSSACPSSPRRCARIASEGPPAPSTRARSRARSRPSRGSRRRISRPTRLAGWSRSRSRTEGTRCSSCRRRRRASPRSRASGCSSAPRPASRRRSAACSSRSRTRSPASATART